MTTRHATALLLALAALAGGGCGDSGRPLGLAPAASGPASGSPLASATTGGVPLVEGVSLSPPPDLTYTVVLLNEPEGDFLYAVEAGWLTFDGRCWTPTTAVPCRILAMYPNPWQRGVDSPLEGARP